MGDGGDSDVPDVPGSRGPRARGARRWDAGPGREPARRAGPVAQPARRSRRLPRGRPGSRPSRPGRRGGVLPAALHPRQCRLPPLPDPGAVQSALRRDPGDLPGRGRVAAGRGTGGGAVGHLGGLRAGDRDCGPGRTDLPHHHPPFPAGYRGVPGQRLCPVGPGRAACGRGGRSEHLPALLETRGSGGLGQPAPCLGPQLAGPARPAQPLRHHAAGVVVGVPAARSRPGSRSKHCGLRFRRQRRGRQRPGPVRA